MAVILTRNRSIFSVAANLAFTGMAIAMLNAALSRSAADRSHDPPLSSWAQCSAQSTAISSGRSEIPPIVVTLGTLTIYRGAAFVLSGGAWVNAHQMQPGLPQRSRARRFSACRSSPGSPSPSCWMMHFLLPHALGARSMPAAATPVAAVYAGIDVGCDAASLAFACRARSPGSAATSGVSRYARRLRRGRQRLRAGQHRGLRHRRHLDCRRHRLGRRHRARRARSSASSRYALPVIDISPFWQMAISGSVIILAVALQRPAASASRGRIILGDQAAKETSSQEVTA